MNTTSKALLSYLASATTIIVLLATAGIVSGQNKENKENKEPQRPPQVQPRVKTTFDAKTVSYTPITIKRTQPDSVALLKQGEKQSVRAKEHSVGEDIDLSFSIDGANWPGGSPPPSYIAVTARVYLMTEIGDANPGVDLTFHENAVWAFESHYADSKTFYINRGGTSEFSINIPTTHGGESMVNKKFLLIVSSSTQPFRGMMVITTSP